MSLAILVHGFNVWDGGKATVGKLRPFFAQYKIPYLMLNYGWFGIGRTYLKNRDIARRLAQAVDSAKLRELKGPLILVGHSNGCAIIYDACKYFGAEVDKAVFINPALDKDVAVPTEMKRLDVWFSPSDKPVKWSKYLPFHPWGEMGCVGYEGFDIDKVRCFDKQSSYPISSSTHSDVFSVEKLPFFAPEIVKQALADL